LLLKIFNTIYLTNCRKIREENEAAFIEIRQKEAKLMVLSQKTLDINQEMMVKFKPTKTCLAQKIDRAKRKKQYSQGDRY
jgi:hypothetical protein